MNRLYNYIIKNVESLPEMTLSSLLDELELNIYASCIQRKFSSYSIDDVKEAIKLELKIA